MSARKKVPSWGSPPRQVTIYPTPNGWRHSIVTETGARICGALRVPTDAGDELAKSAADAMIEGLARDFHGIAVAVTWDSTAEPHCWNGQISRREAQE